MNEISLRPKYFASVSGGKDSFYMLKIILSNLDKYPLDGVVHFELEIDFPFIHDVISYMQSECNKYNIPFYTIRPRQSWEDIYYSKTKNGSIYGFPTRTARWCNSKYKLDCKRQLSDILKPFGFFPVFYIGYCVNEQSRYNHRFSFREIYPLVDLNISEDIILDWAKTVSIFNNYYISNRRCGCMYCPLASKISYAYLYKYYPDKFSYMIDKMQETERIRSSELGRPFSCISSDPRYNSDYLLSVIPTKWLDRLNDIELAYSCGFPV